MIVADVSFIDIFWSILWFYFVLIWLMILFHILSDLFRDHSLSGVTKTLWVLFLVFLPFLAALVYLVAMINAANRLGVRQLHLPLAESLSSSLTFGDVVGEYKLGWTSSEIEPVRGDFDVDDSSVFFPMSPFTGAILTLARAGGASADDVFTAHPETLWDRLRTQ